jgi:cytochrome b561
MRNWFVGTLFFIGAAMITIKGFSRAEDWALDIAGFMAGAMALVPMGWPCSRGHRLAHFAFSVLFFACVGFTSLFCSDTTLNEMAPGPARTRYKIAYRTLAVAMVGLPVAGWLTAYNSSYETLGFQTGAIWAFGIYWLVKTGELRSSGMEREFSKVNCRWTRIGSPD